MKVVSQTQISSPEELILEVSDLLKAGNGSIWSISLEPDHDDGCCGSTPASEKTTPDSGGRARGGGKQQPLCRGLLGVKVLAVCMDNGCRRTGGKCIPQVNGSLTLRCVCVHPKKHQGPRIETVSTENLRARIQQISRQNLRQIILAGVGEFERLIARGDHSTSVGVLNGIINLVYDAKESGCGCASETTIDIFECIYSIATELGLERLDIVKFPGWACNIKTGKCSKKDPDSECWEVFEEGVHKGCVSGDR